MFKVKSPFYENSSYICNDVGKYLHSDGSITRVAEYFETPADAKRVLDKFYSKPKHEWEHGDVFESGSINNPGIMMYVAPEKIHNIEPKVIYLNAASHAYYPIESYLYNAKFLFNIREKL